MNNIDHSVEPLKYSTCDRVVMNKEEINQVMKEHKELETQYKSFPSVQFKDLVMGREYGLAYTGNNYQYYIRVNVIGINTKSARIQTTKSGRIWTVNKITKQNRLFELDGFDIEKLSILEKAIRDYVAGKISEFWKEKIARAEQEQKEQGVYKEGETWLLDEHGFNKVKDNWEISV